MERTSYTHGTPSWTDLNTQSVAGTRDFYGAIFGWEFEDMGAETNHYTIASLHGKSICGISQAPAERGTSFWSTFITVDNLDSSIALALKGGATQLGEKMDISPAGSMAVFADPTGAMFCLWQPQMRIGAELVNEPGALTWNELYTRDTAAAAAFYAETFGWGQEVKPLGELGDYTSFLLSGEPIGGMMNFPPTAPADVPPYWLTYFACEEIKTTFDHAKELGATPMSDVMNVGVGTIALMQDPQGAAVGLIELS